MMRSQVRGKPSVVWLLLLGGLSACGGTKAASTTGGGAPIHDTCGAGVDVSGCSEVVGPSSDDTTRLQTALIEVQSGGTVCMCPGSYHFAKQVSLTVPNVTLRGAGAKITDSVLDFAGATSGDDTMLITADGFTAENLHVTNTPGNGVVVRQSDHPTFRKLLVDWSAGSKAGNGAYAVYPAECTNVLVEDCEVVGASDAAIYVGQGNGAIIRRNKAHGSVLGIELENTTNGEAYDNEAYDNSGGMAVFLLDNLNKKDAVKNYVHDNYVHDNGHDNFGSSKSFVSSVPVGTGIMVVGSQQTEISNNKVEGNESGAVLVLSDLLMNALVPGSHVDPKIVPYSQQILVHGNTFANNGTNPQDPFKLLALSTLENVLWDGISPSGDPASNDAHFCLGAKGPYPTFRMFAGIKLVDASKGTLAMSTDTTPYRCDLPALTGSPP